jgi:hypothetical protein
MYEYKDRYQTKPDEWLSIGSIWASSIIVASLLEIVAKEYNPKIWH